MRKIAAILIAGVILESSSTVSADIPDVSGLNIEELLTLQDMINAELCKDGQKVEAPLGSYLVGRDIAEGSYIVKPYIEREEDDWTAVFYTIEKYEGAEEEYDKLFDEYYESQDGAAEEPNENDYFLAHSYPLKTPTDEERIYLSEGQVLTLSSPIPVRVVIEKVENGLFMDSDEGNSSDQVEELQKENKELSATVEELTESNKELASKNGELQRENESLKKQIEKLLVSDEEEYSSVEEDDPGLAQEDRIGVTEPDATTATPIIEQTPSGINVTVEDAFYTATADLNLRSDASTDAEPVTGVAVGTVLHSTGVCENGWIRIEYNGEILYGIGDYMEKNEA